MFCGSVVDAVDVNIGVSFKKTSLRYAFLYAVELLSVIPAFDRDWETKH